MAPDADASWVYVGSYTDFNVLPHFIRGGSPGSGITLAKHENGRLEAVATVPLQNPAFMK